MNNALISSICAVAGILLLTGCGPAYKLVEDYETKKPKSVVVLPPENLTANSDVEQKVYPIIFTEMSRRGYYCISPELVRGIFDVNKLEDAGRINNLPAQKIGDVFGTDAVLKCQVTDWAKEYMVFSFTIVIGFTLELFDAKTGESLWQYHYVLRKSPGNTNNPIVDLIVTAINAAITRYEPVAQENALFMLKTVPKGEFYEQW